MSENQPSIFKNFSRLIVYTALGLAVFFGLAVFVFVLRGQDDSTAPMPDLISKYYVDVHNDLQRLQLRVKVVKKHYPDQGTGVILYQSLPAGRNVGPREQLYLVVNQPEPVLTMPEYKRSSLAAAKVGIQRITFEERVYKLELGAVTEFETEAYPDNTVIDQFPEPGVSVAPGQKVYFLIARKKSTGKQKEAVDIKSLIGQNTAIATGYLAKMGLDYRIETSKPAPTPEQEGNLYEVTPGNPVKLGVYFSALSTRFRNGLELAAIKLDEPGRCVAEVKHIPYIEREVIGLQANRQVFISQNHTPDEKIKILFFRHGKTELSVKCGDKQIYQETFEPDDLS